MAVDTGVTKRAGIDGAFRFDSRLGGYTLPPLNTEGLEPGAYALSFAVTGDPLVHTVAFRVK